MVLHFKLSYETVLKIICSKLKAGNYVYTIHIAIGGKSIRSVSYSATVDKIICL